METVKIRCKDLMVGDYIANRNGSPMQIVAVDEDNAYACEGNEAYACEGGEERPWIFGDNEGYEPQPIPLTPEILEKNGWIQCKYETCKSLYEYKGLHLRHTMIKRSNGRWVANVDGICEKFPDEYAHSSLRINVFYVHELQHALRLAGLNELADNFKI